MSPFPWVERRTLQMSSPVINPKYERIERGNTNLVVRDCSPTPSISYYLVPGYRRPLLLCFAQLRLEVVDRISLFLRRLHPPLHQFNLDRGLLDILILRLEIPRKRLDLVVQPHRPSLRFNVHHRPRLDLGNPSDPRRCSSD
jgi:hypothetical protein